MGRVVCVEFELVVDLGSRNRWFVLYISYLSLSRYHGPGVYSIKTPIEVLMLLFSCNSLPLS